MNPVPYIRAFAWLSIIAMTLFLVAEFWILCLVLLLVFVILACLSLVRRMRI